MKEESEDYTRLLVTLIFLIVRRFIHCTQRIPLSQKFSFFEHFIIQFFTFKNQAD